jgi:hypothetical protein
MTLKKNEKTKTLDEGEGRRDGLFTTKETGYWHVLSKRDRV